MKASRKIFYDFCDEEEKPVHRKKQMFKEITLDPLLRFSLKIPGEFSHYHIDRDMPLNWEGIHSVAKFSEHQELCPICQDTLSLPVMSKCSHLYCLNCVLHYLSNSARKCTLCKHMLKHSELKPVQLKIVKPLKPRSLATFKLVKVIRNSCTVLEDRADLNGHVYQNTIDSRCPSALFNRFSMECSDINSQRLQIAATNDENLAHEFLKTQTAFDTEVVFEETCDCNMVIHPLHFYPVSNGPCALHRGNEIRISLHEYPEVNAEFTEMYYQVDDFRYCFIRPTQVARLTEQFLELPREIECRVVSMTNVYNHELGEHNFKHLPTKQRVQLCTVELAVEN